MSCFSDKKIGETVQLMISFDLLPDGEHAKVSAVKFDWKTDKHAQVEACLNRNISEIKFGLILKEPSSASVPLRVFKK